MQAPAIGTTMITSLPYAITASGDYLLKSDLTYAGPNAAIKVDASNVSINLNGFSITNTGTGLYGVILETGTNLVVRNGTIAGFTGGVVLGGPQSKLANLQLLNNFYGVVAPSDDCSIQECLIVGTGSGSGNGIFLSGSGVLVKSNQISEFQNGVSSSGKSAFVNNYIANSAVGLNLSTSDYYQGNIATNCTTPFSGGNAIGTENGGS